MSFLRKRSMVQSVRRQTSQSKCVLTRSGDKNWMNRFVEMSTHLAFGDFDKTWFEETHLDILHDLHSDALDCDMRLHLLSLLELTTPLLDSEEKLEQTIGTLLNILQNESSETKREPVLLHKYYQTITSMLLYFPEMRFESASLKDLYSDYVALLMRQSQNSKSLFRETCLNCLHEIAACYPELIDVPFKAKPSTLSETMFLLPLLDSGRDIGALCEIVSRIEFTPDIKFYHCCNYIFQMITSGQYNDSLSLLTLKPFLSKFILSNQIHNIHFALRLLIRYGFEIFSSREEEVFLRQLVKTCTISTLPVGHRLLLLTFIKIAFLSIYKPPLNSPPLYLLNNLHPFHFDGPDSQEKKLFILNEASFVVTDDEFFELLMRLQQLSAAECTGHERATLSMLRTMSTALHKRPQLQDRLLQLLLQSLFSLSHLHYIPRLGLFLRSHWELAQKLVDKFIARLMVLIKEREGGELNHVPLVHSYRQYAAHLAFINWFLSLAHHHIQLTEFQLEFLLTFIYRNCFHHSNSSILALQCCTSILYYQRVTPQVKEALMTILEWLKNERKSDLETSSLAQIYLLALSTLQEEYIKQVFSSDEEEFLLHQTPGMYEEYLASIVKYNEELDCPLMVQKVMSDESEVIRKTLGSAFEQSIDFEVSLEPGGHFERIFAVEIRFISEQIDDFKRIFQLPLVEQGTKPPSRISLVLDFQLNHLIRFDISVKFVDFKGTIYHYAQAKSELLSLEDILIPLECNADENRLCEIENQMLQLPKSMCTVIAVPGLTSFEDFLMSHPWLSKFLVNFNEPKQRRFLIGLPPDRCIMGTLRINNGFINIFITTNNFEIIPILFERFTRNSSGLLQNHSG